MPVTDVIIEEITATVRTVDSKSMLDPKLVRKLVRAVMDGADDRAKRERRRRDDSRIDEQPEKSGGEGV
jgi:HD-GYP domain-containing protein (c-di-GMP phosphodiesterase class II)